MDKSADGCRNLHPKTLAEGAEVQVGFAGEFGAARVSPRELLSSYVGHLVCIEGIVTKASTVRPKWVRSVHYCPANGKTLTREYRCGQRICCDMLTLESCQSLHRPVCASCRAGAGVGAVKTCLKAADILITCGVHCSPRGTQGRHEQRGPADRRQLPDQG